MQLATELSVIGHTLQIRRERPTGHASAPVPHHVIAVAWRIRQLPRPTADAPTLAVAALPGQPFVTSVLAIGEVAQGQAYAWGMRGHSGGATWKTRTYAAGRLRRHRPDPLYAGSEMCGGALGRGSAARSGAR